MAGGLTLRQKLGVARFALTAERVWPRILPLLGAINLYLAFAFYDVPHRLPQWGQAALLGLWGVVLGALLWRLKGRIAWPTDQDCARRLERDSNVPHQPLAAMMDRPAMPGGEALWNRHQQRMAQLAQTLSPKGPRIDMTVSDPWGLRFWVFVPLALGLLVGAGDWAARLGRAFHFEESAGPGFEAWIAPPAATGQSPWVLDRAKTGVLLIPAGSVLRASVPQGWGRASVVLDGHSTDFDGDQDQHVEVTLESVKDLEISRFFRSLGHWKVQTVADQFPVVAFMRPPDEDENGVNLRVGVEAQDDYGLSKVWLRAHPQTGDDVDVDLPLSNTNPRSAKIEVRIEPDDGNLAGQSVSVAPMARDSAGQETTGEAVTLVWPQRVYSDPKALALTTWRKELLADSSLAASVAAKLGALIGQLDSLAPVLGLGLAKRDLEPDDLSRKHQAPAAIEAAAKCPDGHARQGQCKNLEPDDSVKSQALGQPEADIADAQTLMLGAANGLEDQAQIQMQRMLGELSEKLDDALKQGKSESLRQMAQKYADTLEKLLDGDGKSGSPLPFDLQDLQEMLGRLDQLAEKKTDDKLRQRLQALAQKLAEKIETQSKDGHDPFGNQRSGLYTGDDNTTRVPGQNTDQGLTHILNDIRNRLMDSNRSKSERDYLKRLLDLQQN